MIREEDVLEELIRDHVLQPEGDYQGKILEVSDLNMTRTSNSPYLRVKIGLPKNKHVWCFIAGYMASMQLVCYALPKMIGERVRVRVRHKQYQDRTYIDGSILEYLGK